MASDGQGVAGPPTPPPRFARDEVRDQVTRRTLRRRAAVVYGAAGLLAVGGAIAGIALSYDPRAVLLIAAAVMAVVVAYSVPYLFAKTRFARVLGLVSWFTAWGLALVFVGVWVYPR